MKLILTLLMIFVCSITNAQVENEEIELSKKANYYFHFYFGFDKNLLSDEDRDFFEKSEKIDTKYWASKAINLFSELIKRYPNSTNQAEYLYKNGILNMDIFDYEVSKNCFIKGVELSDSEYKKLDLLNLAKIACLEKNYYETARYIKLMKNVKANIEESTEDFINRNLERMKNSGCFDK